MKSVNSKIIVLVSMLLLAFPVGGFGASKKSDTILEGFATSYIFAVYNAHMVIAMAADLHGSKVYNAEQTGTIVNEQIASMGVLEESIKNISKTAKKSDLNDLNQLKSLAAKVREFATTTSGFIQDKGVTADDYNRAKDKSLAAIQKLLGS